MNDSTLQKENKSFLSKVKEFFTDKNGGFNTCAIYDETSSEEDTKRVICDVYIRSFKDLTKYLG